MQGALWSGAVSAHRVGSQEWEFNPPITHQEMFLTSTTRAVRAGIVARPELHQWSSYLSYIRAVEMLQMGNGVMPSPPGATSRKHDLHSREIPSLIESLVGLESRPAPAGRNCVFVVIECENLFV